MNFMHAAFTAGAIAGPLGIGQLIDQGYPWQFAFLTLAFLSALMALAFTQQSFKTVSNAIPQHTQTPLGHLISQPLMLLLTTLILLYVGVEIGTSNWIAEYFVQALGASAATGAYIHGRLADEWVRQGHSRSSLTASDLNHHLPQLLSRMAGGTLF